LNLCNYNFVSIMSLQENVKEACRNKSKINNLVDVIDEIVVDSSNAAMAIQGAELIFKCYLGKHNYSLHVEDKEATVTSPLTSQQKIGVWLHKQHQNYVEKVKKFILQSPTNVGMAFERLTKVITYAGKSLYKRNHGEFLQEDMSAIVEIVLQKESNQILLNDFLKCGDFRLCFLKELILKLKKMSSDKVEPKLALDIFNLLKLVSENMSLADADDEMLLAQDDLEQEEQEKMDKKFSVTNQRKRFSAAWLEFLGFELPTAMLKKVLIILDSHIIPNFSQARLLSDFLTGAHGQGGGFAVLALEGLFTLITEHNLELPDFYTRLYGMIHPRTLEARYKKRFFYLLNRCMNSTQIPSILVMAFTKKLARQALLAAPLGSKLCLRLSLNLIKRFSTCEALINCLPSEVNSLQNDPFDDDEADPAKSGAIDSSLWEFEALRNHYVGTTSRSATVKCISENERDISKLWLDDETDVFLNATAKEHDQFVIAFEQPDFLLGGDEDYTQSLFSTE